MKKVKKFIFNTPIYIGDRWYLAFQQFDFVRTEMAPMVEHRLFNGGTYPKSRRVSNHVVILDEDKEVLIPELAGAVVDYQVPESYVDRHRLWYDQVTDGITDYIKAAKDYLNIEVRFRPEASASYRKMLQSNKPETDSKVSAKKPKDIKDDSIT